MLVQGECLRQEVVLGRVIRGGGAEPWGCVCWLLACGLGGGNLALAPGDELCPTFPFSPARECLGFSLSLLSLREA